MNHKSAVIFGAGKIARAFLAHLLTLSGYRITFVEKHPGLVALLRQRERYKVHILGAPEKSIVIGNYTVLTIDEIAAVAEAVAQAAVVFVSVGGPNLPGVAPLLAAGVKRAVVAGRPVPLDIVVCENYFHPARWMRELMSTGLGPHEAAWFGNRVGLVETMVLRSSIEPTEAMKAEDPLALQAQDAWELPADGDAFVGPVPHIIGLAPRANFQASLVRKLFTYNGINAVVSYLGHLKGHRLLSEAANDTEIAAIGRSAGVESSAALVRRYGFDLREQTQFAEAALAKYQRAEIVDPIERNARDPLRKLARNDRLVGPACLALEHGIRPVALAKGIAAALRYDSPGDPGAEKIQCMIAGKGVAATVPEVCGIPASGELLTLIVDAYEELGLRHTASRR